jgi:hypothetical protein
VPAAYQQLGSDTVTAPFMHLSRRNQGRPAAGRAIAIA